MRDNRIGVVMAGGSGERFWPVSRTSRAKQLLKLASDEETLLGEAVTRLRLLVPPEKILIVTSEALQGVIREAETGAPPENVLAEPCKRNTSGALACVAAYCLHRYGEQASELTMAVVPADSYIGDDERFCQAATAAMETVERDAVLAVFGFPPTRPETGYGYLEVAENAPLWGSSTPALPIYRVIRFHEKPDLSTAESYVASGRFFWNSGLFFWKLSTFLEELEHARPPLARAISEMAACMTRNDSQGVRRLFEDIEDLSIDYALMEHARQVVMVRADFPWDDVSAWDALARIRPTDENGNVVIGDHILVDASDCLVYGDPESKQKLVAVLGVKGLAVVVSDDAVLVCPKEHAQEVRRVVAEIKARDGTHLRGEGVPTGQALRP